ncbi:hypothetical protein [Paenibacillus alvei]|uniref:hypothetical protein n=1 Tax=Paenibacillus alvei TaxID=44250 RepID=UPI0003863314|nr:hypothetical protein [Paenibacillus alvei]EPY10937.1 hypothetical protein PAAL66ix_20531 [Paenibacillus alvei A6-6i-x]
MILNISDEKFELIYLSESTINIDYTSMFSTKLVLDVWGVTLPISVYGLEAYGLTEHTKPFNDDIYVSGYSRLTFHDVTGGNIEVELYSKEPPYSKLSWPDNSLMKINKTWGEVYQEDERNIYEVEGTLGWPYGRCDLSVVTRSNVSIELDSTNFIPVKEYMLNTKKYGWSRIFN